MVNITNTKSFPYISPPYISPPPPLMYKPTKKCLRMNISPGLIFRGLRYIKSEIQSAELSVGSMSTLLFLLQWAPQQLAPYIPGESPGERSSSHWLKFIYFISLYAIFFQRCPESLAKAGLNGASRPQNVPVISENFNLKLPKFERVVKKMWLCFEVNTLECHRKR